MTESKPDLRWHVRIQYGPLIQVLYEIHLKIIQKQECGFWFFSVISLGSCSGAFVGQDMCSVVNKAFLWKGTNPLPLSLQMLLLSFLWIF